MRKRKHARRVPGYECLEGRRLLSASVGEVGRTQAVQAANRYLLNGTLTDLGSFSHHIVIPGNPQGGTFFTTADLFGRLKSPGQVGAPGAVKFAEPVVVIPVGVSPPSFPEPVDFIHPAEEPNLSGATITLEQVKKSGKHLSPIASSGTMVLSISSSTTNAYRFTVSSATGKFAAAAGGTGTLSFINPKSALPYLRLQSD